MIGGGGDVGLHFGSKKNTEISIVFEDLSSNSVFCNRSEALGALKQFVCGSRLCAREGKRCK